MEVDNNACAVCVYVDGDATIKPVKWCSICGVWICDECRPDLAKRAEALVKRLISIKLNRKNRLK